MIIDLNICAYAESDNSCKGCLCSSCAHFVPFYGCILNHVDCDTSCHAIGKCMAFISMSEKGVHS